jgi:hypothetical protein
MKMNYFAAWLALTVATIAAAAAQPARVEIYSTNLEAVRAAAITALQTRGFMLSNESSSLFTFTKPMEGFRGAIAQLALGNSYSTTPQIELKVTLAKLVESIQITGFIAVSTQMPGGQVRQQDMSTDARWVRDVQGLLSEIDAVYRASAPAVHAFPKRSIGVVFESSSLGAVLIEVVSGGPAERAGLTKGDEITHINGISLAGMSSSEIQRLLVAAGDVVELASSRLSEIAVEKADPSTFVID